MNMNRAQHLQWCKDRALDLLNKGDISGAFSSFNSDMQKHPETANHIALLLGMKLMMNKFLSTPSQMRSWIEGFN